MNNKTYVFECLANVLFDCKQCSCTCVILKYKRLKFAAVCIDASFLKNTALIRKKKLQLSSVIVRQVNLTGLFITSRVKFKCSPDSSY